MSSRMSELMENNGSVNTPRNGNNVSTNEVYARLFEKSLEKLEEYDFDFDELLDIARENSSKEDIWVIGSFLYRGIIDELYKPLPEKFPLDVDFLVKMHTNEVYRPRGWEIERTTYGDLAFMRHDGSCKIDINTIFNLHGIESRKLPPNIRHFYTANPLNIQSITYDCNNREISGWRGIEAIAKKVIRADNLEELTWESKRRSRLTGDSVTADNLIKAKAKELGFCYELPEKS